MTNLTAKEANAIVNDSIEIIKLKSVDHWLEHVCSLIKVAAQRAETELVLTSYFWTHSSSERAKVIQTLKEQGFHIHQNTGYIFDLGEPKLVVSWKNCGV